jgi:phage-related protein
MAERKLNIQITGDAKGAIGAMALSGAEAEKMGGKFSGVGSKIGGAFKAMAVGTAAIGVTVAAVAAKSAATFSTVGGEVLKLQRYTGDSAESASRMRTAFKLSGIDVDGATKSLGIFSKNVVAGKIDKLGLDVRDTSGHIKPMNTLLMEAADKFKGMPNGIEKTNLALKMFGKSGSEMTKFLSKGKDGIAELEKESDKYGLTLSGKNLDAVKKSVGAHREQTAAMEGLQVQIGIHVLPVITKLTTFIASEVPKATRFFQELVVKVTPLAQHLKSALVPAMELVRAVIQRVIGVFEGIGRAMGELAEKYGPKILTFFEGVGHAIAGLAEKYGPKILTFFESVGHAIAGLAEKYGPKIRDFFESVGHKVAELAEKYGPKIRDFFESIGHKVAELAEKYGPKILTFFEGIGGAVGPTVDGFKRFTDAVVPVAEAIGRFVKENPKPVIAGLGAVVLAVVVPAFVSWAIAAGSAAIATITATAPVILLAAAIALLAGGIVYAYQHFSVFRTVVDTAGHVITGVIGAIVDVVKGFIGLMLGAWQMFGGTIIAFVKSAWDAVYQVINGVLNVIMGAVRLVMAVIHGDWGKAWDAIKQIVSGALDIIRGVIDAGMAAVRGVISAAWDVIKGLFSGAWDSLKRSVSDGINSVVGFFSGIGNAIGNAIGNLGSALYNKGKDLITGLINGIKSAPGAIMDAIKSLIPGGGVVFDTVKSVLGFAAAGGPVKDGMPYIVGEEGPELMIPNGSGTIIPNHKLTSATGTPIGMDGGTMVHVTVNVAGTVTAQSDLAESIRSSLIDIGRRTGRPVLAGY